MFIKGKVRLYEWLSLSFQYFTFLCERQHKAKWKTEFDLYHGARALCVLYSNSPFFFYLHIDVHSEITTKYSTLIYMKNYHVKKCTFFPSIHASCMGTFVQLISLTKISQLDEYHQKKSRMYPPLQISTKCAYQISFNFMCSKALKVTRLHKCHCVITVLGKACVPQRLRNEITTVCY